MEIRPFPLDFLHKRLAMEVSNKFDKLDKKE